MRTAYKHLVRPAGVLEWTSASPGGGADYSGDSWAPPPESDSADLCVACESAFLTSFQVLMLMLVWGPSFENHQATLLLVFTRAACQKFLPVATAGLFYPASPRRLDLLCLLCNEVLIYPALHVLFLLVIRSWASE